MLMLIIHHCRRVNSGITWEGGLSGGQGGKGGRWLCRLRRPRTVLRDRHGRKGPHTATVKSPYSHQLGQTIPQQQQKYFLIYNCSWKLTTHTASHLNYVVSKNFPFESRSLLEFFAQSEWYPCPSIRHLFKRKWAFPPMAVITSKERDNLKIQIKQTVFGKASQNVLYFVTFGETSSFV